MITPGNGSPGTNPDGIHHADLPIAEKVCVVTGAKTVAITYSGDRQAAHEVYLVIQALGVGCLLAHMDVTDRSSVRSVLLWITDQVGKVDVLVNAEEASWPESIGSASVGERLKAVGVNIRGQALTADEVLPFMGIQRSGGLVIGIAVEDDVSAALKTVDEPGAPVSVVAAISPMTAPAASRQVTMKVLPFGPPEEVAKAVVGLATA